MIELPFSPQQFFDVFRHYNEAVWPAQWVLYALAVLVAVEVSIRARTRRIPVLLALLWLWMGVAYHLAFFTAINPAAGGFAVLFVLQAGLLLNFARARDRVLEPPKQWVVIGGRVLIAYALIGYPMIGYWAGQRFPELPTFGVPCPTTIFTLGVLVVWCSRLPWWVLTIPVTWALLGTSAAVQLSVPEDFGLTIAGLFAIVVFAARLRRSTRTLYTRPTPRASATRLM